MAIGISLLDLFKSGAVLVVDRGESLALYEAAFDAALDATSDATLRDGRPTCNAETFRLLFAVSQAFNNCALLAGEVDK